MTMTTFTTNQAIPRNVMQLLPFAAIADTPRLQPSQRDFRGGPHTGAASLRRFLAAAACPLDSAWRAMACQFRKNTLARQRSFAPSPEA